MRKHLLTIALVALAIPAVAGTPDRSASGRIPSRTEGRVGLPALRTESQSPILEVEGEISRYSSHVYWIHEGNSYYDEGIIASICRAEEGPTVYIRDLMPAWEEGWLQGTAEEDGLHFPSEQLVSKWGIGDIYMSGAVRNPRTGNFEIVEEFVLSAREEGGYKLADRNGADVFIIAYIHDGTLVEADYGLLLVPFDETEATPPAEAQEKTYLRTYFDGASKFPYSDVVKVASLGDDMWLEGFNGHQNGYVAGRMENDGSIYIPTGQFVGFSGAYAQYMFSAEVDEATNSLEYTGGLTLYVSDPGWRSGQTSELRFGFREDSIDFVNKNFTLVPYVEGVEEVASDTAGSEVIWYDLAGREVSRPERGLYVRVTVAADGTRSVEKVAFAQ